MKIILFRMAWKLLKIFKKPSSPMKELTNDEFNDAKFKARIAFIDDEEIVHVERLRSDGYNITHFSDIDNIDDFIRKKYHVIILDIQGVGKKTFTRIRRLGSA